MSPEELKASLAGKEMECKAWEERLICAEAERDKLQVEVANLKAELAWAEHESWKQCAKLLAESANVKELESALSAFSALKGVKP
jgi:hypothetical protein